MKNRILALLVGVIASGELAIAQSSSGKSPANAEQLSVQDLLTKKPAPGEDKADQIITNRMMRAITGSLSKWSFNSALNANGGSLEKPLDPIRPNIRAVKNNETELQSISGDMGVKYRVSAQDMLRLRAGVRVYTPFTSSYRAANSTDQKKFDDFNQKADVFNPSLTYTRIFNIGATQNYIDVREAWITDPNQRRRGAAASTDVSHTLAYKVGASRWTVGNSSLVSYMAFDKSATTAVSGGGTLAAQQSDYGFGLFPFVEYIINDKLNLRYLTGFSFQHVRNMGPMSFIQNKVYQSFGVGISITRDIFLYPNIQFLPDDLRADRTNVAIRADINMF